MAQQQEKQGDEPYGIYSRGREGWYESDVNILNEPRYAETRELLETYSGISKEDVIKHIVDIRNRAWNIWPYPCVGQFRFLDLSLGQLDWYPEVLKRAKEGQKVLDLGCCFAQDIRRLVADGAPSENLYATDLRQDFLDLGYELFNDRESLKSTLLAANIFDDDSALRKLDGQIDIIVASSFFHLFSWTDQKRVAKRCISLLRPRVGSLILGRQTASSVAGPRLGNLGEQNHKETTETSERKLADDARWRHNEESWIKIWQEIGEETHTKWDVQVLEDESKRWKVPPAVQNDGNAVILVKFAVRML